MLVFYGSPEKQLKKVYQIEINLRVVPTKLIFLIRELNFFWKILTITYLF